MKTDYVPVVKERWDFRFKISSLFNWYPYKLDYLLILLILIFCSVVISFRATGSSYPGQQLVIQTYAGQTQTVNLNRDTIFQVAGRIGMSTIEIKSGKARIISSPCPRKICINQGWISSPGNSITCIPNGILIKITGNGNIDAISY